MVADRMFPRTFSVRCRVLCGFVGVEAGACKSDFKTLLTQGRHGYVPTLGYLILPFWGIDKIRRRVEV